MTHLCRAVCLGAAATVLVSSASTTRAQAATWPPVIRAIHHARNQTWHYQRQMGTCCTVYGHTAERSVSRAYRFWVLHLWRHRWKHAHHRYVAIARAWYGVPPSHVRIFMCIHPKESIDWYAATGNGFYGGLQFSAPTWTTVRDSAPVPLPPMANEASPREQVYAADYLIYHLGADFATQWPNTSPGCV